MDAYTWQELFYFGKLDWNCNWDLAELNNNARKMVGFPLYRKKTIQKWRYRVWWQTGRKNSLM